MMRPEGPWDAAAADFDAANPDVMAELVNLARRWRKRGRAVWGVGAAFEVLRWQRAMQTNDANSDFKLNHNYKAWFARELMRRHPDLDGVFRLRGGA